MALGVKFRAPFSFRSNHTQDGLSYGGLRESACIAGAQAQLHNRGRSDFSTQLEFSNRPTRKWIEKAWRNLAGREHGYLSHKKLPHPPRTAVGS